MCHGVMHDAQHDQERGVEMIMNAAVHFYIMSLANVTACMSCDQRLHCTVVTTGRT
jgi:hypothetical protein